MSASAWRWPMVGRDVEVRTLCDAVADPGVDLVLVSGPAGVGKTRLVDSVFERLLADGRDGGRAAAGPSLSSVPLGALAHLLPVDALAVAGEGAGGVRLFAAVRDAFARPDGSRFVLVVDDIRHLDDASVSLLAQLVNARTVVVLATHRASTVLPEGVVALSNRDRSLRLDLGVLSEPDTRALLEQALGGDIAGPTERALWERSRGNPLYLRELVDGALAGGHLVQRHGLWTLEGELIGTGRLVDLVMERVERLGPDARELAALIALCAPVELTLLERGSRSATAGELERAGIATVVPHAGRPSLVIAHPLYAEVIVSHTPEAERRRLLLDHVREIEASGAIRAEDAMRRAVWRLDAGESADSDVLVRVARAARAVNDYPTTRRLAQAALDGGAGEAVVRLLGDALYELGEFEQAEVIVRAALEHATDELRIVEYAVNLRDIEFWGLNDADRAIATLREARARVTSQPFQDALRASEAMSLAYAERPQEALALLEEIGLMVPPISTMSGTAKAAALARVGRTGDAIDVARRSRDEQFRMPDPYEYNHPSLHLITLAFALIEAGSLAEASTTAQQAYAEALDIALPLNLAWGALNAASAELQAGHLLNARRWASEALALSERASLVNGMRLALTILLAADAQGGRTDELEAVLARLQALPEDPGFLREQQAVGTAWACYVLGRIGEAQDAFRTGIERAQQFGLVGSEGFLRHEAARLGWTDGWHRFDELLPRSDSTILRARADHVRAVLHRDPELLLEASTALEACGADLAAAEAAAQAADRLVDLGDTRGATKARRRADELIERCQGPHTPALAPRLGTVEPLSVREREVASLAVSGLGNREIADRLYVSKRTVDNHLQRIYTKLGVQGRAGLAEALARSHAAGDRPAPTGG
ncbi:MAG: LuxR C-terminal-related transcriptional regulator [Ilumatobacteraceae bacterium]